MVGFMAAGKRSETVPMAIENGCDMILFNKDLKEDYQFMLDGYKNGLLSRERLLDANRRILALKASLRLHEKKITAGSWKGSIKKLTHHGAYTVGKRAGRPVCYTGERYCRESSNQCEEDTAYFAGNFRTFSVQ